MIGGVPLMHLSYPTPLCCQDGAFSAIALGLSKFGLRWTAPVLGVAQPDTPMLSGWQVMSLGFRICVTL